MHFCTYSQDYGFSRTEEQNESEAPNSRLTTNTLENQARKGSFRMKLGDADQAWRVLRGNLF